MHSTKQSNWILGLGIVVAILLIVSSFWLNQRSENSQKNVESKSMPEIGQTVKRVNNSLGWLSSVIKTLN